MNAIQPARRMEKIPFSGIRKVFEKVNTLKSEGVDVINLCIGRPDFDTPAHIKATAQKALDEGMVHYTSNYGHPDLRKTIADKLARENGIPIHENEVIVTVGANEAVFLAMMAFLNPGDEVIVPNPAWPHYFYCAEMAGAKTVFLPLREENKFQISPQDVLDRVSPRTRMIVINTPNNPTGAVMDEDVLKEIVKIAKQRNIIILSDEIYEKLIYGSAKHFSAASIPGAKNITLTVNGFSKAYSMTGWRLGYVAGPKEMIDVMIRLHQYTVTCATSFAQAGGLAAYQGPQQCLNKMLKEFDRRRKVVVEGIQKIPRLSLVEPRGTFYAFVNIKALGLTSEEVADYLLKEGRVAVVPGSAFGKYGEGFVRIAFSNSLEKINTALERISHAISKL